jgi:hypothetical protein
MVTPGATSEVDEVAPEVCAVLVVVVARVVVVAPVVVDPLLVAVDSLPVDGVVPFVDDGVDPPVDSPAEVEPAELGADDDPAEVVSAVETP